MSATGLVFHEHLLLDVERALAEVVATQSACWELNAAT